MTDDELCTALEGTGEVLCTFSVFCITRDGFLLLALAADKKAARMTLALYHPQSLKARVLVVGVSCLIAVGLHRFLPQRIITIRETSPLSGLRNLSDQIGFLLGNVKGYARRAIVVHRANEKDLCYVVDKIGFGEAAKKSVVDERLVIEVLPRENTGVPQIWNQGEADGWAFYTTPYLDGRSPRASDQEDVLRVLKNWSENGVSMPLGSTPQWVMIKEAVVAQQGSMSMFEQLGNAGDVMIKVGLFHGDFAPWNIKVSPEGDIHVMDWEDGCNAGPAGWDWLHYMIQRASLVDHLPAPEILKVCRRWAKSEAGNNFLTEAGWGDEVELWLGSYLMYSLWISKFDRGELLRVWGSEV